MIDDEKKPGKEPSASAKGGDNSAEKGKLESGGIRKDKDTPPLATPVQKQDSKTDSDTIQRATAAKTAAAETPADQQTATDKAATSGTSADKAAKSKSDASPKTGTGKGGGSDGPPPAKPAAVKSHSNWPGVLALILALLLTAAAIIGGWWLWQRLQAMESTQAGYAGSQELTELRDNAMSRAERLAGRVDNLAEEHQAHVQNLARTEAAMDEVSRSHEQVTSRMQRLEELAAAHRQDWILSEVDYLFAIAEQRVQFRRDIDGALAALRDADGLLARLGAETVEQRQQIRRAIDALLDVRQPDRGALAAELGRLIEGVENWEIAQPEQQIRPEPMPGQPDADLSSADGWQQAGLRAWEQFKNSLSSLVVVRRDDPPPPLMSPEEGWFLRENVRLQLQTARLALLEDESQTFRDSLQQAEGWLGRHFSGDDAAVQDARETLNRLGDAELAPELPDLGELLPRIEAQREDGA